MSEDSKEARSQEQREWVRLECRAHVHYRVDSEGTFKAGLASDISEGGIKFEADRQIPLRTILRLVIQLPLPIKPLKTRAEVVSAREGKTGGSYKIGVRFLDIGERAKGRIAHYIDEITSDVEREEENETDKRGVRVLEERENLTVPDHRQVGLSAVPAQAGTKEKKESNTSALIEEVEALEMIINEEKGIYQLGELATFSFHDFKGCPPLMLGLKFKEAVTEPLLRKYGLKEEEVKEAMEGCKKKFKALGTRCYIHALKASHRLD